MKLDAGHMWHRKINKITVVTGKFVGTLCFFTDRFCQGMLGTNNIVAQAVKVCAKGISDSLGIIYDKKSEFHEDDTLCLTVELSGVTTRNLIRNFGDIIINGKGKVRL